MVASAFAVVGFEWFAVPILCGFAVHRLVAPPARCAVDVVVEESAALCLVYVSESAACGACLRLSHWFTTFGHDETPVALWCARGLIVALHGSVPRGGTYCLALLKAWVL